MLGSLERGFVFFYEVPQIFNLLVVFVMTWLLWWAIVGGAVEEGLFPESWLKSTFILWGAKLYGTGLLLILIALAVGILVRMDWLTYIALLIGRLASVTGVRSLRGLFGAEGCSAAWLHAREFARSGVDSNFDLKVFNSFLCDALRES